MPRNAPIDSGHNAVIRVRGSRWAVNMANVSPWTALVVVAVAVIAASK